LTRAEGRSGAGRNGLRRVAGLAVAVAAAASLGVGVGVGCSHDTKPVVAPDEHPPLPPASGTPIGYLVDDAGELKLTGDQLAKLQAIDQDLAAKLEVLDGELRGPTPTQSSSNQTGVRRRGGGRRGGGRRGGTGGAGSGSGSGARSRPAGGSSPDKLAHATEERATDVRVAIDQALAQLDIVQRVIAKRVLTDHGVDLDTGRPKAAPAEGEDPDEPSSGSGSDGN
jgi:hypothetical protein